MPPVDRPFTEFPPLDEEAALSGNAYGQVVIINSDKDTEHENEQPRLPLHLDCCQWPTELMRLIMGEESSDDEWAAVMDRIQTHPEEITVQEKPGGQSAIHAACIRYPPTHVVQALLQARPEAARALNFNTGETPLHLALYYAASEEVQLLLLKVAPETAAIADPYYGDTPLHFVARSGASPELLDCLLQAAPQCIDRPNKRGMYPLWLLPRSYLEANDMDEILDPDADDYRYDWDSLTLFLKYSNHPESCANNMDFPLRRCGMGTAPCVHRDDFDWVVHAAAATPSCPREVLAFLCRMYPEQALRFNQHGYTPLLLAVQTKELDEPAWTTTWDENEEVDASTCQLHNGEEDEVTEEDVALSDGGVDFIAQSGGNNDAQESKRKPTAVDILLEWSPRSACVEDKNPSQRRLPLTHALVSGQSWKSVRSLIVAFPRAINTRDAPTGMYMFQLAALESSELDSVYSIVRSLPQLIKTTRKRSLVGSDESPSKKSPLLK